MIFKKRKTYLEARMQKSLVQVQYEAFTSEVDFVNGREEWCRIAILFLSVQRPSHPAHWGSPCIIPSTPIIGIGITSHPEQERIPS